MVSSSSLVIIILWTMLLSVVLLCLFTIAVVLFKPSVNVCIPHPDAVCAQIHAPVCGVDGVTYSNSCEARRLCVPIDYQGECEKTEK